jgi:hypothetical protein
MDQETGRVVEPFIPEAFLVNWASGPPSLLR